ncbi:MAG: T9SS type A sorting domain-containing protein [Ignavibacteria bacterium]|nr:T9SS type A sorting domain-containing protein [Ignavibacteria bacterium]
MKNKILKYYLLFSIFLITSNDCLSQSVIWSNIFGNPGNQFVDIGYNCIQSRDGSFLATGRMEILPNGGSQVIAKSFVARIDTSGNLVWVKLIGDSSISNLSFTLEEDPLGNIFVPHYNGINASLSKLDAKGNILWNVDYSAYNIILFNGISFQDEYRNIVLLGFSRHPGLILTTSVTKVDSSGRFIWSRSIYDSVPVVSGYSSDRNSFCFSSPGYYVCGAKGANPFIVKLDTSGNIIWNNQYLNSRGIWSIAKITDNSLIASCQLTIGTRLLKIDSSGNQYWTKDYSTDSLAGSIGSKKIIRVSNNKFALGTSRGQYFARHMTVDSSGNILTSKFFNFSTTFSVYQENINYCIDSGFIFAGYIRNWDTSGGNTLSNIHENIFTLNGDKDIEILIFKTDKTGKTTSIINNFNSLNDFNLVETYPNPFNSHFQVRIQSQVTTQASIRLYDVSGKTVRIINNKLLNQGVNKISINADNLGSGVYFLKVKFGEKNYVNRILLVK